MQEIETSQISHRGIDPVGKIQIDAKKGIETIFLPHQKDIHRCYFNNKLLSRAEAQKLAHSRKIKIENIGRHKNFVYHKSLGIIPFMEGDFIITDDGYITTDGTAISYYDNRGKELCTYYDDSPIDED